jgi:light-harvesting complex I chlorophyll a/b binding protein 4
MAAVARASALCAKSFVGQRNQLKAKKAQAAVSRSVVAVTAEKKMWYPDAISPGYLNESLAGDYGFDPMGFGADPVALKWYRQSELMHARWAMMGVAGIMGQELFNSDVFWYEAALPENLPGFVNDDFNLGTIFAFEFLMMHYVEVRRWQDYKNPGSVNEDPIFKGNSVPNTEMGYPGGIFDPFGFGKGDMKTMQTKEIKNGRLAMVAFVGFTIQAQALGEGPLASLGLHTSNPVGSNIMTNLGKCVLPDSVVASGVTIPTPCLWP